MIKLMLRIAIVSFSVLLALGAALVEALAFGGVSKFLTYGGASFIFACHILPFVFGAKKFHSLKFYYISFVFVLILNFVAIGFHVLMHGFSFYIEQFLSVGVVFQYFLTTIVSIFLVTSLLALADGLGSNGKMRTPLHFRPEE